MVGFRFGTNGLSVDGSLASVGGANLNGAVAQLGEHLLCKQGVSGSIPLSSTKVLVLMRVDIQTDRSSPIVRRAIAGQPEGRSAVRSENILVFEEIKVCITSMKCCLFCKNCEEKIDLEASRYGFYPCPSPFPMNPLKA